MKKSCKVYKNIIKGRRGDLPRYCFLVRSYGWCEDNDKFCLSLFNKFKKYILIPAIKKKRPNVVMSKFQKTRLYHSIFQNQLKDYFEKDPGIAAEMKKHYSEIALDSPVLKQIFKPLEKKQQTSRNKPNGDMKHISGVFTEEIKKRIQNLPDEAKVGP